MNNLIHWFKESEIWASIDASFTIVSILVTFGTFVMVVRNYRANKKQLEPIKLHLHIREDIVQIPSYILRKNFNRVEVKGILKELHDSKDDYEIDYIANPKSTFLKDIFEIQSGSKDDLVIEIKEKDIFVLKDI